MEYAIVFGIIIWGIIFGAFCSFLAKQKKRDQGSWFALGFFFSLIALIAIAATPVQEKKIAEPIRLEPRKPLTRGRKNPQDCSSCSIYYICCDSLGSSFIFTFQIKSIFLYRYSKIL